MRPFGERPGKQIKFIFKVLRIIAATMKLFIHENVVYNMSHFVFSTYNHS